jgi:hypothetical protein
MKYTVDHKKRTKTIRIKSAWYAFDNYKRGSYQSWCVLKDGKFFCEARSESAAKQICTALNNDEEVTCNQHNQTDLYCQN